MIFATPEATQQPPSKLTLDLNQAAAPDDEVVHTKPRRRTSRPIRLVPLDDTNLRRSKRTTKYDGFKVNQPSDRRTVKSKVVPRSTPNAIVDEKQIVSGKDKKDIPGPTTIEDIQLIGVNMCGIDASELTPVILQSEAVGEAAENN